MLIPAHPTTPIMSGIDASLVDSDLQYTLTCTVQMIKPEGSIYWLIDGVLQTLTHTQPYPNSDGKTYRLVGNLTKQFTKTTNRISLECSVTEKNQPGSLLKTEKYKDIDVRCK